MAAEHLTAKAPRDFGAYNIIEVTADAVGGWRAGLGGGFEGLSRRW